MSRDFTENVLEIEIVKINDEWSVGYITYQNEEVLKIGKIRDEEIKIYSLSAPDYSPTHNCLYIRGKIKSENETPFNIPNNYVDKLKEKVRLINSKYGISKRWRAKEYEKYYFINSNGNIVDSTEYLSDFDNERYYSNNYFNTREQAVRCWENYIKPAYRKFWEEEAKNARD